MSDKIGAYRVRVYNQPDRGQSPRIGTHNYGTLVLDDDGVSALPHEDGVGVTIEGERFTLTGQQVRDMVAEHGIAARDLLRQVGALVVIPVWRDGTRFFAADENVFPTAQLAGMIYVTASNVERVGEMSGTDWQDQLHAAAVAEVQAFSSWHNGEVYRFIVSQFTGDEWLWLEDRDGYFDAAQAERDAMAEVQRYKNLDAQNGDTTGAVSATRRAVALVREQLADLAITTRNRRAHLADLAGRLVQHDKDHPLHVTPDAPHWHAQAHGEADVEVFPTQFHALDWASGVLESLAESEHQQAAGVTFLLATQSETNDQLRDALVSHARGNELYSLAVNARKTWEQASAAPFERAPAFASDNEAANTVALRKSAEWNMDSIMAMRDVQLRFWKCEATDCAPRDDE